jgi:hypothetical protein
MFGYSQRELDAMVWHYARTALWSEIDDDGHPLDDNYDVDDIDSDDMILMRGDVTNFLELVDEVQPGVWETVRNTPPWTDPEQVGHDLWLTRNHHGAGFWDRWWNDGPESQLGDLLTKWADSMGSASLYVGDSGQVHYDG